MVAAYAAYLWRLEHLGHNWNLIMASPVKPLDLFIAKFAVVAKLALLTHIFVICTVCILWKNLRTSVRLAINETAIFSSGEELWERWLLLLHSWFLL